jgi:hypothetical protein
VSDEWHLDSAQVFKYLKLDLFPGSRQAVVVFRPSFRHAWFKAIGAIGDTVLGDGPQHFLIQGF